MKKQKWLMLGLTLASTILLSQNVFAADEPGEPGDPGTTAVPSTTDGHVTFKANDDKPTGEENGPFTLIQPGTFDKWITIGADSGKQTLDGSFRFAFVPNFEFGEVKVSAVDEYHSLLKNIPYQAYDVKNPEKVFDKADTSREIKYLPPFLQVINLRGTEEAFKVSVSATKFKSTSHELVNSAIQIQDFESRNNLLDKEPDSSAATILKAPVAGDLVGTNGYLSLQAGNQIILSTVEGQGSKTDSSASSLVFEKDYKSTTSYAEERSKTAQSVRLFVPSSDSPKIGESYTSEITWSLENAK